MRSMLAASYTSADIKQELISCLRTLALPLIARFAMLPFLNCLATILFLFPFLQCAISSEDLALVVGGGEGVEVEVKLYKITEMFGQV